MKIIAFRSYNDIDIQFLDEYGCTIKNNTYANFKRGTVRNPYDKTLVGVGRVGIGYPSYINCKPTQAYRAWCGMLHRCYSKKDKANNRSYFDICQVCEEWLCFQNFARWYEENKYECDERLHVDKDILFPGNKIYSPQNCMLVPQRINMLFTNRLNSKGLPNGMAYTKSNRIQAVYNGKHLGIFNTLEEAFAKYAKTKKEAIVKVANSYKNSIPKKLYDALIKYEVKLEHDKNYRVFSEMRGNEIKDPQYGE